MAEGQRIGSLVQVSPTCTGSQEALWGKQPTG